MSKQSDTQDNYKAGDRLKITRKSLSIRLAEEVRKGAWRDAA